MKKEKKTSAIYPTAEMGRRGSPGSLPQGERRGRGWEIKKGKREKKKKLKGKRNSLCHGRAHKKPRRSVSYLLREKKISKLRQKKKET